MPSFTEYPAGGGLAGGRLFFSYTEYPAGGGLAGGSLLTTAPVAVDTFTGVAGTSLQYHTPDSGGYWFKLGTYTGGVVLTAYNSARSNDSGPATWGISQPPVAADYTVTATVIPHGYSTQMAGLVGRADLTHATFYGARYNGGLDRWELYLNNNGSLTLLGSSTTSPLTTSRVLVLGMVGTTITLKVDGTTLVTATDGTITTAGMAGVWTIGQSYDA